MSSVAGRGGRQSESEKGSSSLFQISWIKVRLDRLEEESGSKQRAGPSMETVFGSLGVDANSATPYTDATEVRE